MKSPLVDALRQAHGDSVDDSIAEADSVSGESSGIDISSPAATGSEAKQGDVPPSAEKIPAHVGAEESGDADLNLLNTGLFAHADPSLDETLAASEQDGVHRELLDETADALSDQSAEESIASKIDQPSGVEDEQPILSIDGAATSLPALDPTENLSGQGAELNRQMPLTPKLGRLTPIICLIALSASAGAYYILNHVAANSLNEDLSGMAQRKGSLATSPGVDAENRTLADAGRQLFSSTGVDSRVDSYNETPTPVPVKPSTTSVVPTPVGEAPRAAFSSSATDKDNFRDRAHSFVVDAYVAYQTKDYARAEKHYVRALEIEPNHADALAGIAAVHLQTNRTSQALAAYEKLLSVDPNSAIASAAILSIHANDADSDSESELKLLLQRYPEAHQLHYALGSVLVRDKRWADAKQAFLAAYRLAPNNANYSYNAAVSMEKVGEQDAARFYYEAALATAGQESNIDRRAVMAHLETLNGKQRDQL